jgi:type II secretory pathway pseudopilin PulG
MPILGFIWTIFSAIRSNKYLMYGLAAAVFIAVLLISLSRYGKRREKEGAARVATEAARAIIDQMEVYRAKHAEIKRLPLSDRARRLRETDRREG